MDREKLLEEVVSQIRACLVSTKGKCDLRQIKNDYRMLMGGEIPYAKLGYKTLEQFICSVPTLSTTRVNGQLLVDAKVTDKSSHISNFVDRQRTRKRTRAPMQFRAPPRQAHHRNFSGGSVPKWRPRNTNNNYRKSYQSSPRPAAVAHNQFVNIPTPPRLSARLNVSRQVEQPQTVTVKPESSVLKVVKPENGIDPATSKAKQRITKRMANININSNNIHSNGDGLSPSNWNLEIESSSFVLPTDAIRELQNESLAAVDLHNPVWKFSSSEDSPESVKNIRVQRPKQNKENITIQFTGDALVDLEAFVKAHNLGKMEIKIYTRQTKPHKPICYDCKIKVGPYTDTNYPTDCRDEMSAKQAAAKRLLDLLLSKINKPQALLISDDQDILDRIPPIVKLHHNGIWNWQIEADYVEMFNEQLPINWLEVIDSIPCILVLPVMNKFVLRFCDPTEVFQKGTTMPPIIVNVSVPSNTVKFEDDGSLEAEITCTVSAGEVWCRQCATPESEAFCDMIPKLEEYYNNHQDLETIDRIEVGGYYVALFDNMWCRVRVFDVNGNDVNCFCIDFGDEWVVPKNYIFRLNRQFAKQQAQAFVCRLAGVEELYEASKASEYFNSLVGKVVQVQVDPASNEAEKSNPNDPALSVVLYDMDANITINERLISAITMESATPVLNKTTPSEAYVTHALDDGSVYIQIHSKGYEQLRTLLDELEKDIIEHRLELPNAPVTRNNSQNKLYITKCDETNSWCRAEINDWSPDNKYAQILFVDYGTTTIITVKDHPLYLLDDLSDTISKFPYQALKVHMPLDNISSNFVNIIKQLMPPDQPVLVKLIMNDAENGPIVEIFKRSDTDNVLFSVNNVIMAETEFKKLNNEFSNNTNKIYSNKIQSLVSLNHFGDAARNVPSSGSLSCPVLPKIGNYFDVKIPCAVHPHNFFVQPYESHEKLQKLMTALQEKYKEVSHSPIQIDDIVPGKIYASKHEDGMWYRTSVIKVIHSGSISVFYCDFGYYANLTLQQLIPLSSEFMELPHQAIKAKLADIQPKNLKWSMDDCKFFESLVCRKSFVSILVGIEKDVLYRSDTVLLLKLIDTSTKVDVHIDRVLVKKDIAVDSNKNEQ